MPRPKGPAAHADPAPALRTSAAKPFGSNRTKKPPSVTSERIAEDLAAFRKAGGRIEVLGTTRVLRRITPDDTATPPARHARAAPEQDGATGKTPSKAPGKA